MPEHLSWNEIKTLQQMTVSKRMQFLKERQFTLDKSSLADNVQIHQIRTTFMETFVSKMGDLFAEFSFPESSQAVLLNNWTTYDGTHIPLLENVPELTNVIVPVKYNLYSNLSHIYAKKILTEMLLDGYTLLKEFQFKLTQDDLLGKINYCKCQYYAFGNFRLIYIQRETDLERMKVVHSFCYFKMGNLTNEQILKEKENELALLELQQVRTFSPSSDTIGIILIVLGIIFFLASFQGGPPSLVIGILLFVWGIFRMSAKSSKNKVLQEFISNQAKKIYDIKIEISEIKSKANDNIR